MRQVIEERTALSDLSRLVDCTCYDASPPERVFTWTGRRRRRSTPCPSCCACSRRARPVPGELCLVGGETLRQRCQTRRALLSAVPSASQIGPTFLAVVWKNVCMQMLHFLFMACQGRASSEGRGKKASYQFKHPARASIGLNWGTNLGIRLELRLGLCFPCSCVPLTLLLCLINSTGKGHPQKNRWGDIGLGNVRGETTSDIEATQAD